MVGLASFESGVCVSGEVGVGELGERTKKIFSLSPRISRHICQ